MPSRAIPKNTQIGIMKLAFNDLPEGDVGVQLHKIAVEMGCNVNELEGTLVVVQKPHGDALQKIVEHRIYGGYRPRDL